jgi:mono/diheme cytochrome c family protein
MRLLLKALLLLIVLAAVLGAATVAYVWTTGLSARVQPGSVETSVARGVRTLAVSRSARDLVNPVTRSPEAIADGLAHFADHCASCHANDGSGNTDMGRNMYPRVPDMRLATTQNLSDGELFWIIENGIRFTGMPAWGTGDRAGEEASWRLVHFIRYLPNLTTEDLKQMEALNPRPPEEIRQEIEEEEFLAGTEKAGTEKAGAQKAAPAAKPPHKHPGGQDE